MSRDHPHLQGLLLAAALFAVAGAATPVAIESVRGVVPAVHRAPPTDENPAEVASEQHTETGPSSEVQAAAAAPPEAPSPR